MLLNGKKAKPTLTAALLLCSLRPVAVALTIVGLLVMFSSAAHAQEQTYDPTADVEAYLDGYDTGVPTDLATTKIYNHFVLAGTAGGQKFSIDYWTPGGKQPAGGVKIATNPVTITKSFNTGIFGTVSVVLKGVVETWKVTK